MDADTGSKFDADSQKITIAEIRLDRKRIYAKGKPFIVCLTDVATGKAVYKITTSENVEAVLKASSALPILYRTFPIIEGRQTMDGGIADPIPVDETIKMGARKIMIIRSRPKRYEKRENLSQALMLWKLKGFPSLQKTIINRVQKYNDSVFLIHNPPPGISIVEICPPDNFRLARLSRNVEKLVEGYQQGLRMARVAIRSWESHKI